MSLMSLLERNWLRWLWPDAGPPTEPLMYRVHLFEELLAHSHRDSWVDKLILEIGPKDGLDTRRLASLNPSELVLIELPEKEAQCHQAVNTVPCRHRIVLANFMYMTQEDYDALRTFDLIWCTGVIYHNAEQLRFLRRLYKKLNVGGYLVLESATLRSRRSLRGGSFVEIHYPDRYRGTRSVTHLPTAGAIRAWVQMVGFTEIHDSDCYRKHDRRLLGQRMACISRKTAHDDGGVYYDTPGFQSEQVYRFGDST